MKKSSNNIDMVHLSIEGTPMKEADKKPAYTTFEFVVICIVMILMAVGSCLVP